MTKNIFLEKQERNGREMSEKKQGCAGCQGVKGAFSHLAAREIFPEKDIRFYATFDAVLAAVEAGEVDCAVLPVENSAAGRVADMHRLLRDTDLFVTAEHFVRVRHCLLGTPESDLDDVKTVVSHPQALSQCASFLKRGGYETRAAANTAMAAETVAREGDKTLAAVASRAAAELYGLKVLAADIEDSAVNTTRFWVMSAAPAQNVDPRTAVTSFIFWVKNEPAVLYKCLGGLAKNGVDLLRLESYVDPERFLTSAGFLVDVAAGAESGGFKRAMAELSFFAQKVKILGTYAADPFRAEMKKRQRECLK